MALADGRAGRHADHDVRELPPARLAHAQPAQLDRGRRARRSRRAPPPPPRRARGPSARRRSPCISRAAAEQDEPADEERRDRVAVRMAGVREDQADEHRDRAQRSRSPKCSAFDASAALSYRRDVRHETIVRLTSIAITIAEDDERVPGASHRAHASTPASRSIARTEMKMLASERKAGLGERREVLRLAVPELVLHVGGARRDTRPRSTSAARRRGRCPSARLPR